MAKGIAQVHVRKTKGHMTVIAMGQTPRGQKYIKQSVPLKATEPIDKDFKSEMKTAVDEMLG